MGAGPLPAERLGRIVVPDDGAWLRASRIISKLAERGWIGLGGIRPSFYNDSLLAATGLKAGHIIVTHNLDDFELIRRVESGLRIAAPFP